MLKIRETAPGRTPRRGGGGVCWGYLGKPGQKERLPSNRPTRPTPPRPTPPQPPETNLLTTRPGHFGCGHTVVNKKEKALAPVVTSHPSDTHQIRKKVSAKFLLEFEFKGTITHVPSLPSASSTSPSASHSASPSEEQKPLIGVALGELTP